MWYEVSVLRNLFSDTPNSESYILLSNIYATHKDYHDHDIFEFDCDQFQTPGFVQ